MLIDGNGTSAPLDIQVTSTNARSPRVKPRPRTSSIPTEFYYLPSPDGIDENLLVLLHGLGDTHAPFAKLGRRLNLPQTALLALCAPQQVPFHDEPGFQWYASFDPLGELLSRPDPTPALELLHTVIKRMVEECLWRPERIHLCGFAQGGTVVGEFGLRWWRGVMAAREKGASGSGGGSSVVVADSSSALTSRAQSQQALGSIVAVCGPLLSYPTLSARCPTPVLVFHRRAASVAAVAAAKTRVTDYRKGYMDVRDVCLVGEVEEAMPRTKEEWRTVMEFWSERLGRRLEGEGDNVYEVVGGLNA